MPESGAKGTVDSFAEQRKDGIAPERPCFLLESDVRAALSENMISWGGGGFSVCLSSMTKKLNSILNRGEEIL